MRNRVRNPFFSKKMNIPIQENHRFCIKIIIDVFWCKIGLFRIKNGMVLIELTIKESFLKGI
jgi:hypothetical protein